MCAVCHFEFHGAPARALTWCKKHQFYVCQRCFERNCAKHHAAEVILGSGVVETTAFIFFLVSLCFSPVVVGFYDFWTIECWKGLPVTPVGELPDSGTVKLEGVLNSTDWIALGYHEYEADEGYSLEWNTTDSFKIEDGTGSIRVDCSKYYWIRDSNERYRMDSRETGYVYSIWTRVVAIGEVRDENGEKALYLKYLAPAGTPLESDYFGLLPAFIVLVPLGIGLAWEWRLLSGWRRLHEEKVQGAVAIPIPKDRASKDASLNWMPNSKEMPFVSKVMIMIALAIVAIFITILIWAFLPIRRSNIYMGGFMVSLLPVFLIIMPLAMLPTTRKRPSMAAISAKGIHFWYDDPEWRMLNDDYIGWDEIDWIGFAGAGKTKHWAVNKKDGVSVNIETLDQKLIDAIVRAWKDRTGEPKEKPITMGQIIMTDFGRKK